MDGPPLTVDALADYCRTQAGLLAGHAERLGREATDLLDEADDEIERAKARLDHPPTPDSPSSPASAGEAAPDIDEIEETQAVIAAKQARMTAFRELSADYTDLASVLDMEADDPDAALERVVTFEVDRDAAAYFDRETLAETVAGADGARD